MSCIPYPIPYVSMQHSYAYIYKVILIAWKIVIIFTIILSNRIPISFLFMRFYNNLETMISSCEGVAALANFCPYSWVNFFMCSGSSTREPLHSTHTLTELLIICAEPPTVRISFKRMQHCGSALVSMRIRIQLLTSMRIRIHGARLLRIRILVKFCRH